MKLPISRAVYVPVKRNWLARESPYSNITLQYILCYTYIYLPIDKRQRIQGGTMTVKKSYYNRRTISPIVFWLLHPRRNHGVRAFTGFMRQQWLVIHGHSGIPSISSSLFLFFLFLFFLFLSLSLTHIHIHTHTLSLSLSVFVGHIVDD